MTIDYFKLADDSRKLAKIIKEETNKPNIKAIYGIPSGGILPAYIVSQELGGIKILSEQEYLSAETDENNYILIIDDLIDSGETLKDIKSKSQFNISGVLYKKESVLKDEVSFFVEEIPNKWVNLPHEQVGNKEVEKNVTRLLEFIGEDPKREGLKDTPRRVIKSYNEIFSGYTKDIKDVLTVFDGEEYDQMVILKDIEFYSTCEHHMLPFFGKAHVAYIPSKKIVGISKLARVVEIYARRLQNQERLTKQVGDALNEALNPLGVAVVMEAQHFCMKCRGVNKQNSSMKTAHLVGVFKEENTTRKEFYDLIDTK